MFLHACLRVPWGLAYLQKKRRKRKRPPKGFDPANPGPPPDPERWLPKWERSDYRRRHKKKRDAVKGTQVGLRLASQGPNNSCDKILNKANGMECEFNEQHPNLCLCLALLCPWLCTERLPLRLYMACQ